MIDALDVEHVDDRRDPAPERPDARSSVWIASLSPCSSARAQMPLVRRVRPCSSISLNRSVLRPFSSCSLRTYASIEARPAYASMQPRRPHVQRAPSISTTTCPISPAPPRPVHGLPVEDQTAADARSPEHAQQRAVQPPGPSLNSASVATCTSLPTPTPQPSALSSVAASGNVPSQPGRLRALVTLPSSIVPGRADPHPGQRGRLDLGRLGRVAQRRLHLRRHIRRAAARGRRPPSRAEHVVHLVDDHRLDLRPAEIDSAVAGHRADHRRRATPGHALGASANKERTA